VLPADFAIARQLTSAAQEENAVSLHNRDFWEALDRLI
jgi:hypothetical protein